MGEDLVGRLQLSVSDGTSSCLFAGAVVPPPLQGRTLVFSPDPREYPARGRGSPRTGLLVFGPALPMLFIVIGCRLSPSSGIQGRSPPILVKEDLSKNHYINQVSF